MLDRLMCDHFCLVEKHSLWNGARGVDARCNWKWDR